MEKALRDTGSTRLKPRWIVGFTGHRDGVDPARVRPALVAALQRLQRDIRGELVAVSSVAVGGDTLFVEAALSLGIPWKAMLPFGVEEFRRDFADNDWRIAQGLLERAVEVETIPPAPTREDAYLECGVAVVNQADVVVALWNGKPARAKGGTGDIVACARSCGKPLVVVELESCRETREGVDPARFVAAGRRSCVRRSAGRTPASGLGVARRIPTAGES